MKRGLLLVDIDQVVCDFVTPFCEWGNKVFGKDVSPADVDCYDMFKLFDIPNDPPLVQLMLETFFASDTAIPEIPGAVDGLTELASNFRIWYATARPKRTATKTVDWLSARGIAHRVVHCSSTDKTKLLVNLPKEGRYVKGIVEDNPETALLAAEKGYRVWLLDYAYNREAEHPLITRVSSWSELVRSIKAMDDAPQLTMSENEYSSARLGEALRQYLRPLIGPCDVEFMRLSEVATPRADKIFRFEVNMKVVS